MSDVGVDSEVLAAVYDAAVDPDAWPKAIASVAHALDSAGGALTIQDHATGRGRAVLWDVDPACEPLQFEHFAARNPFVTLQPLARIPRPTLQTLADWDSFPRERLERTEYFNDFLVPFEMTHLLMLGLDIDGDEASVLNLTRPTRRGAFQPRDVERAEALRPHIRRALLLSRRIGEHVALADSLADVLHASANAILLLDVSGRIRFANHAAESLLARGDGLVSRGGRLFGATPRVTTRLAGVIAEASGGAGPPRGSALALPRPSGARPLALVAAPLGEAKADAFERRPRVLVCVTDPDEAPVADAARLRSLFGFTAAESAIAARLAAGEEVRAIADALGISHNTVRRHLQALFPKAGVSRQSELAILLTRLGNF